MARVADPRASGTYNGMVRARVAEHDDVRAQHGQVEFPATFRCFEPGLVRVFAGHCADRSAN